MRPPAAALLCVLLAVVIAEKAVAHAQSSPLDLYSRVYREPDFFGVMVKLTYIGPQGKPVYGLLLSSHRLPDLEAFKPHYRHPELGYQNDDHGWLGHMTLETGRLRDVVLAIARFPGIEEAAVRAGGNYSTRDARIRDGRGLNWSLMVVDTGSPHRPNAFEALLTGKEVAALLRDAASTIEREDPAAARGLRSFADQSNW